MKHTKFITLLSSSILIGTIVPITTSCNKPQPQDITIKNIAIGNKPTKTSYAKGEKLELAGLSVNAIMSDYSTKTLTTDQYTVDIAEGTQLLTIGTKTITVTLKDSTLKTSFNVTVGQAIIKSLTITHEADKYIYNSGDKLELTNFEVTATYSDNTSKKLSSSEYVTYPAAGDKVYETQYLYVYTPNYSVYTESYIIVTSDAKNFVDAPWDEVGVWCGLLEKGIIEDSLFCSHFKINGVAITKPEDLLGQIKTVSINGSTYNTRVIGYKHDTISGTTTKALFTFDFQTVFNTLYTWGTNDNCNYLQSELRKGVQQIILPKELKDSIKIVDKEVAISTDSGKTYTATKYQDSLFLLTLSELGIKTDGTFIQEGNKYEVFSESTQKRTAIKYDTSGQAAVYWLSSPNTNGNKAYASAVHPDGVIRGDYITSTHKVAPSFCI